MATKRAAKGKTKPRAAEPDKSASAPAKNGRPKGRRDSKTAPRRVAKVHNALRALELRRKGLTHARIAEDLGISQSYVTELLQEAMGRQVDEAADEARRLDLERLDDMLAGVYDAATGGDIEAINAVMSIMSRRAKMLGYEAPSKTDNTNVNVNASVNAAAAGDVVRSKLARLAATAGSGSVAQVTAA